MSPFWLLWISCNDHSCIHFWVSDFNSLRHWQLGVELPGHQLSLWVTSSKLPNHFPKGLCHCTFPQQGTRVLIFLHPLQHLLSSIFLRITTLEGARRHPTVGLICTPQRLMALSIFSMCLLVVCVSFLEKRLFKSFAPFLIGLFVLSLLHYKYSSSLQDTGPLSDCKYFL